MSASRSGALPPLGAAELAVRRPVWAALSDLFLDGELDAGNHRFIALVLRDSGYDDATWHAILAEEVAPVCGPNLLSIAGVWGMFDRAWLEESILAHRARGPLARGLSGLAAAGLVAPDVAALERALARLRQDPAALLGALVQGDPPARARAAADLGFLGVAALPIAGGPLEAAARGDPSPAVRAAAVKARAALDRSGAAAPVALALGALSDADAGVRRAAAEVLAARAGVELGLRELEGVRPGGAAVEGAASLLLDRDPEVRTLGADALRAIAVLRGPPADGPLAALLGALGERDPAVRGAVGRAIAAASAGEPARLAPVLAALDRGAPDHARTAACALAAVAQRREGGAAWAVAPLVEAFGRDDLELRRHAAEGLGALGAAARAARPLLLEAARRGPVELRRAALGALGRLERALGTPSLEVYLRALGAREGGLRFTAEWALGQFGALAAPALPRLAAMERRTWWWDTRRRSRAIAAALAARRIREAMGGG